MERGWMTNTSTIQMPRGHGQEDVPSSTRAGGGAIGGCAGAETGETAEEGFKCGGMHAWCAAERKIPVRMSRHSVV
jgi:hypothetical protein